MPPMFEEQTAINNFFNARARARLHSMMRRLRRKAYVLLPFEDVYPRLTIRGQRDRGYQTILLAQIVGSEGRHRDFDRDWLPHSDKLLERWQRIDQAQAQGRALPPVELYQLGDVYFVRDGHHRISVARQRGQLEIDAHVVELVIDIPLTPDLTVADLARIEEQNDFFTWTELARLRPGSTVEVSHLGGYLDLVAQINRHRAQLCVAHHRDVTRDEAITDWYDSAYRPLVQLIRDHGLLAAFPGRTEADVYVCVSHHHELLSQQMGHAIPLDEAVDDYGKRYGLHGALRQQSVWFRLLSGARRLLRGRQRR